MAGGSRLPTGLVRPVTVGLVGALLVLSTAPVRAGPSIGSGVQEHLDALLTEDPGVIDTIEMSTPLVVLADLGFTDFEQRLVSFMGVAPQGVREYGFGDDPEGEPVIGVAGTAPVAIGTAQIVFAEFPSIPMATIDQRVLVTSGDGIVPGVPYTLMWVRYDSPYDLGGVDSFANRGFVTALPDVPLWESTFAGDLWWGGHQMPALISEDPGAGLDWSLIMTRDDPEDTRVFFPVPFDGFAILRDDMFAVGVATGDLVGSASQVSTLRGAAASPDAAPLRIGYFSHERPYGTAPFTPGLLHAWPLLPRGYEDFVLSCAVILVLCQPLIVGTLTAPAPVPTPEQEEAPEEAPQEEPAEPVATPPPEVEDMGGGVPWIAVFIVVIAALVAFVLWWARFRSGGGLRPDDDDEEVDPYRDGPTRERGGGGTPPPYEGTRTRTGTDLVPGDDDRGEPMGCEWGLSYHDGSTETVLRRPPVDKMDCCWFVARVSTSITPHTQVARARQTDDERLRTPDFEYEWQGVSLKANASTRSGPAGDDSWMQGLGEARSVPGEGPASEGGPEVAAHLLHVESTTVDVTLRPGCPQHENRFALRGESRLEVLATHECTNADGEACPVEVNAFGFAGGFIERQGAAALTAVSDWTGSDPDELKAAERSAERLQWAPEPHTVAGAHDHAQRDRATYEVRTDSRGNDVVDGDSVSVRVTSDVELDAGQEVPPHVYDTTGRVSAHIEASLGHDLSIEVVLTPIGCESNGCGGHGRCGCHAMWRMNLGGTGSRIETDQASHTLSRAPDADRSSPVTGVFPWSLA